MPDILWDAGIASKAQLWADRVANEGGIRHSYDGFGENLAQSSYRIAGGKNSVDMW